MRSIIRNFFGVLVLLSIAWMVFGLFASGDAYTEVTTENAATAESDLEIAAGEAGAAIGAGLGIIVFLCTGIPAFLFSLIIYWQMGRSIQRDKDQKEAERRHQELMMQAKRE